MTFVKGPVPIPEKCRYCGHNVSYVNNAAIYGKSYGDWPFCYLCGNCKAYVGVHHETKMPTGTLADHNLRSYRKIAKDHFNDLLEKKHFSREECREWLSKKLGISTSKCHFGSFEVTQCIESMNHCIDYSIKKGKSDERN